MKRGSILFLQGVIILIGIGALIFMLWEPHIEGRNLHSTLFEVYFHDPFLAYAYIASTAFFTALYQAFKLLIYIGRNEVFSERSQRSLKTMRYAALSMIAFILPAELYLCIVQRHKDDIAGGVFMGLLIIFISTLVTAMTILLEDIVRKGIEKTSQRD